MSLFASLGGVDQPSWLDARDPRLRVLAALLVALVTVNLNQPAALASALLLPVLLALSTNLKLSLVWSRLIAFEGFMVLVLLFLPFSIDGTPWLQLGPLVASWEGLERALVVVLRANTVVLTLLCLVGTLEPEALGHALARLRVPDKLVHLFLLTVRYVSVLFDEYQRLRVAMRARAFSPKSDRHTWRSYGWLIGMLLVRSLERSQRILWAMKCRGFQGRFYLLDNRTWQRLDSAALLGLALIMATLLILEHRL